MDNANLKIEGHVIIKDPDSGEVFVNKRNAIHPENMSLAIASSLGITPDVAGMGGFISEMVFGSGGVVVGPTGNIIYNTPNVANAYDTLFNETFLKQVSFQQSVDPANNIVVTHAGTTAYSDIVITATLGYGEPATQSAIDSATNQTGNYVFDEIGLRSQTGSLLTHLIFHPIQKSANRIIQVIYTVRITVG
jgi:hypothetical protein